MLRKKVWVEGNLDSAQYQRILSDIVFPALDAHLGAGCWVWTQDGAPSHTSNSTQTFLLNRLGSKGFWSKDFWPPSSPNLNPLDYHMWTGVEEVACAKAHSNVNALKASVVSAWDAMPPKTLEKACRSFRPRIEACIAAEGNIFEK